MNLLMRMPLVLKFMDPVVILKVEAVPQSQVLVPWMMSIKIHKNSMNNPIQKDMTLWKISEKSRFMYSIQEKDQPFVL